MSLLKKSLDHPSLRQQLETRDCSQPWRNWNKTSMGSVEGWVPVYMLSLGDTVLIIAQPCTDSHSAVNCEAHARLPSLDHQGVYLLPSYNTLGKLTLFQWLHPESWDISKTHGHVCVYKTFNLIPTSCSKNPFLRACSVCKESSCFLIHSVKHRLANQTVDFYYMVKEAVPCYVCLITPFLDDTVKSNLRMNQERMRKIPRIFCNENSCSDTSCL